MLDEATSALDPITEEKIRRNLDKLNCTRIVIAHRLNTIINADRVIVLRNGTIEDAGTHSELLNRCSYYAQLYKSNIQKKIISENRKEECYLWQHY